MSDEKTGIEFDWQYDSKESVDPLVFLQQISNTLQQSSIVSFGEQHDLRVDESFSWILSFQNEILEAYHVYSLTMGIENPKPMETFQRCLRRGSRLINVLSENLSSFEEVRNMHVGRMFALHILPLARNLGYTEVVLEGVEAKNPARLIDRSTDKIGDLLRILMAMVLGMRVHGAYADGLLSTAVDVGVELQDKINEVKTNNPDSKIIVYNGAMHNMTIPYQGTHASIPGISMDVSQITYAPDLIAEYGSQYSAIDMLNKDRTIPTGHFSQMQEESEAGEITCFKHGIRQQSFVIG